MKCTEKANVEDCHDRISSMRWALCRCHWCRSQLWGSWSSGGDILTSDVVRGGATTEVRRSADLCPGESRESPSLFDMGLEMIKNSPGWGQDGGVKQHIADAWHSVQRYGCLVRRTWAENDLLFHIARESGTEEQGNKDRDVGRTQILRASVYNPTFGNLSHRTHDF